MNGWCESHAAPDRTDPERHRIGEAEIKVTKGLTMQQRDVKMVKRLEMR